MTLQRSRREGMLSAPRARSQSSSQAVDLIVLTSDPALLATLREAAGAGFQLFHAETIGAAVDLLLGGHCGVLVIDMGIVGNELARLTEKLQAQFPGVVLLATGHRNEQNSIAALVASGRIYRFLHKPVSPARAELFLSAASRRYGSLYPSESRAIAAVKQLATPRNRNVLIAAALGAIAIAAGGFFWSHRDTASVAKPPMPAAQTTPTLSPAATQLDDLLARAATAYRSGNRVPPAADNAFDLYRAAQRLDANNVDARIAIERIVEEAQQQVSSALTARDATRANAALDTLRSIAPTHPQLAGLQRSVAALRPATSAPATKPSPAAVAASPNDATPVKPSAAKAPATPNLDIAKAYLAANQLVDPIDASALGQLRQARDAGEDQSAVQIAATDLGTRLLNLAVAAATAGDASQARKAFDAAASLDREFETSLPELDAVEARIRDLEAAAQRTNALNEQLNRVTKLRSSGRLIAPAGDNAYEALKPLLDSNTSSSEVRTEQQRLTFALLESVRTALAAGDIDQADILATRAEEIQPGLQQSKMLREQIGAARAERDNQQAVVQAASLPRRRDVPAVYPREALLKEIEGWVDLEFVVSTEGVPTNISVKASEPARTFEIAATQALRQWRFEPIIHDGAPQARRATLRMEFKLKR